MSLSWHVNGARIEAAHQQWQQEQADHIFFHTGESPGI